MAGRNCTSCGAEVGILVDRCPSCGADPDLQLLELGLGASSKRRGPAGAFEPGGGDGAGAGRPRGRIGWRQWAPIVVVVAAVWGFLVVTAGSDDDDDDGTEQAQDESTSTSRKREEERTPGTRRGTRVTTTTVLVEGGLVLGEPTGWQLVFGSETTHVLDLDSGRIDEVPGGRPVAIGANGVVTASRNTAHWRPAPFDDGTEVVLADGQFDQGWIGPDGTVWLNGYDENGGGYETHVIRVDPGGTSERIDLPPPAWALGATRGGLLLNAPGGVYILSDDGEYRRISEGSALGASGDIVAVQTCDEALECTVLRIDATDGRVIDFDVSAEIGDQQGGPVSIGPDGRIAHVIQPDDGEPYLAVDGTRVADATVLYQNGMAWSPDGRWLAFMVNRDIRMVDTLNGGPPIEFRMPGDGWLLGFVSAPVG